MDSKDQSIALVTGCSDGGIGHALAAKLARRGFRVFATARSEKNMNGLEELGCELLELDVTSEESVQAALKEVSSRTGGRLNLLINNAGSGATNCPLLDVDLDAAKKLYDVNVWGLIRVTQAFTPLLIHTKNNPALHYKAKYATIVNIGSITGLRTFPFRAVYGSSKAAVHAISDALRSELKGFGVNVTVAVTGGVSTQIGGKAMELRSNNADENSIYGHVWNKINGLLLATRAKQDESGMKPENYADELLNSVMLPSPPSHYYIASYSTMFRWLAHLPTWVVDRVAGRIWHLDEVYYDDKKRE